MTIDIEDWGDIASEFEGAILLGNGASIAVDKKFNYESLKQYSIDNGLFEEDVEALFDFFHTDDFELILRIVWHATNVNKSLDIEEEKTLNAYIHVRDCLISSVRAIHCDHDSISDQFAAIYKFLKNFHTVISLNYDLIVYWSLMHGLEINDKHAFKDCFTKGKFDEDWNRFREPIGNQEKCSLVFYPHGNLILARDKIENERKISSDENGLLESILDKWERGSYVPLFVSEGTSDQKIKSIQSSYYLNTVYREVIPNIEGTLVVYGWGFGEQDKHLLKRLSKTSINRIAVSVYDDDQAYCLRVKQVIKDEIGRHIDVVFFNSESAGCWNAK